MVEKIKPFNDIWFKDCFHMAFLPAIGHVLGNNECVLFNQLYLYHLNNYGITLKCREFHSLYDIAAKKNISCMPFIKVYDIAEFIQMAIRTGHFIIVGIDNYYEEIRKDFFQKKHQAHSVLLYGIEQSLDTKVFVLDQPFFHSYAYQTYQMSFYNLINAYNSYVDRMKDNSFFANRLSHICCINSIQPSACLIYNNKLDNQETDRDSRFCFKRELINNHKDIYIHLENILQYKNILEESYSYTVTDPICGDKIIEDLNNLILSKNVEFYVFERLFKADKGRKTLQSEIINGWSFIRAAFSKARFSNKANKLHSEKCKMLCEDIYRNELLFYNIIFQNIEREGND